MNESSESDLALTINASNRDPSSSKDPLTCCYLQSKLIDNQQLSADNEGKEHGYIYAKCKAKNDLTCAQFYEEKIRSLLEIFSEVIENFSSHSIP
jgi:hypothetical protein